MRSIIFLISSACFAQAWSGIIDSSRAVDWAAPGVTGGIPTSWTQCGATISAYTGTAATINNAISACSANTYVQLGAGTFNLSTGIDFGGGKTYVALKGAGANQTFLIFTGDAGCNGARSVVCMHSTDTNWKGGPTNSATWSAGYSKGTATITLSAVTNLKVGTPIMLDQTDDTNDNGAIIVSADTAAGTFTAPGVGGPYSLEDNGGGNQRSGRQQQQVAVVTQCGAVTTDGASCSGTNVSVTISPALHMPNWSGSKTPQAWWATSPSRFVGIENLSIDATSAGSTVAGVQMFNCANCWVKGIRSVNSGRAHVQLQYSPKATIRDSYFFLTQNSASQSYGFECYGSSNSLVENNIYQAVAAPLMINGNCDGTVIGYNFTINNYYTVSSRYNASANNQHTAGIDNVLLEGNYMNAIYGDVFHGTHHFVTYFRNRVTGPQPACWQSGSTYATSVFNTCTSNLSPVVLQSFTRFNNLIGNILGTTGTNTTYGSIYDLNSGNSNGSVTVPDDPNVSATLMRWGNCDSATGFGSCKFDNTEVPSSLSGSQTAYSNPVPASQTLPSSFYLTGRPSWFRSVTYPPIGPDVSSGNISGTGGRANMIPAQECFLNVMGGPSDGTGAVLSFNASTCYGAVYSAPTKSTCGKGTSLFCR